jgi:ribosome maturation factor RimP
MMHELVGKMVEVNTTEMIYRGKLVEVGETEVYLQSDYGWITIPIDKIADVTLVEGE